MQHQSKAISLSISALSLLNTPLNDTLLLLIEGNSPLPFPVEILIYSCPFRLVIDTEFLTANYFLFRLIC